MSIDFCEKLWYKYNLKRQKKAMKRSSKSYIIFRELSEGVRQ